MPVHGCGTVVEKYSFRVSWQAGRTPENPGNSLLQLPKSSVTANVVSKTKKPKNKSVADGKFQHHRLLPPPPTNSIERALAPPLRPLCRCSGRCHVLTLHVPTSPLKGRNGGTMFSWSGCRDPSDDLENLGGLQEGRCATSGC